MLTLLLRGACFALLLPLLACGDDEQDKTEPAFTFTTLDDLAVVTGLGRGAATVGNPNHFLNGLSYASYFTDAASETDGTTVTTGDLEVFAFSRGVSVWIVPADPATAPPDFDYENFYLSDAYQGFDTVAVRDLSVYQFEIATDNPRRDFSLDELPDLDLEPGFYRLFMAGGTNAYGTAILNFYYNDGVSSAEARVLAAAPFQ